jgi:hypothetical protein
MDSLCRYCHAIYDWSNWPGLSIFNEMRVRTVQDLNDKLQKAASSHMDEATDFEMGNIEYTESLRKRVSELNLEISLYTSKAAPSALPIHPELEVEARPTWSKWTTGDYQVNFGILKGERIFNTSHNCMQCRLVKTLMETNEQALGDLLSAEVDVSLMIDCFTLKPRKVDLLLRESRGGYVWEEIQLLRHRGEFCSRRHTITNELQTLLSSHPSSISLVSCCELNISLSRYGVTDNRNPTTD